MMKLMLIMLALFSFQHNTRYPIEEYQCEKNAIKVKYEDHWYALTLFNVVIQEKSDVCSYLEGEVSIEMDPYVKIENPLNAYVYVNDVLLQQILIDDGVAQIKIDHPKYQHHLTAKHLPIMKEVDEEEDYPPLISRRIALGCVFIWISIVIWWIYRFYKSRH